MVTQATAYEIQGRTLTLPIEVRDADSWAAQFFVPAKAAQAIVDPTGLEVAQPLPGRAVLNIAIVSYRDTDLDAYNELAVAFLVRLDDAPAGASALQKMREVATGRIGVYIHQLPVTQTFTLEAGRTIWGYPKFLADIDIAHGNGSVRCSLEHEGTLVLALTLREGGPIRLPQRTLPTYSLHDGVVRRTEWEQQAPIRARLGGARLHLGHHAIADELRTLGLPKRALMCSTMRNMQATFGAATTLRGATMTERTIEDASVTIRTARPDEAPRLTEIAHAAKRHWGYDDELISLWADDLTVSPEFVAGHDVHCAVRDEEIVGFYALSNVGDQFELEHMWVHPTFIRSGVGAHLFRDAVKTVREHGGAVLEIASDPNAEGFYLRMGARSNGSVPSRPEGRTLPRLTLTLHEEASRVR